LPKSHIQIFFQNDPLVSHVADLQVCLFSNKLKEKSTFVHFRESFRQYIFALNISRKGDNSKCENKIFVSTLLLIQTGHCLVCVSMFKYSLSLYRTFRQILFLPAWGLPSQIWKFTGTFSIMFLTKKAQLVLGTNYVFYKNKQCFRKLAALYDNYDARQTIVEDHTEQEQQEEWDFLKVHLAPLY